MLEPVESVISEVKQVIDPDGAADPKSVTPLLGKIVSAAGAAYAFGFIVIMVHTALLHAPVVEALQFQNIVAGLPVWALTWLGLWLWPLLMKPIKAQAMKVRAARVLETEAREIEAQALRAQGKEPPPLKAQPWWDRHPVQWILLLFTVSAGVLSIGLRLEVPIVFGVAFGVSDAAVLISAGVSAFAVYMWVQLHRWPKRDDRMIALFQIISYWSGLIFFVLTYTLFLYPLWPQSWGGGRPVQARILVKDVDTSAFLTGKPRPGPAPGRDDSGKTPIDPLDVTLYYRTSSYLLIGVSSHQHLVQVPVDQVRSIEWLESQPH